MTKPKHLPECFNGRQRSGGLPCICDRLRACEARVLAEQARKQNSPGGWMDYGYAAGLDAAREAVVPENLRSAYLVSLSPQEQRIAISALELAAKAIDALRREQA